MGAFPPDKDLKPGETMAAAIIRPDVDSRAAGEMIARLRETYPARNCDVICMAVPEGKGRPFVDGLMESMNADEGGRSDAPGANVEGIPIVPAERTFTDQQRTFTEHTRRGQELTEQHGPPPSVTVREQVNLVPGPECFTCTNRMPVREGVPPGGSGVHALADGWGYGRRTGYACPEHLPELRRAQGIGR